MLENIVNDAILIECGFLTNIEECNMLCDEDYQIKLASSIADGIHKFKIKDNK